MQEKESIMVVRCELKILSSWDNCSASRCKPRDDKQLPSCGNFQSAPVLTTIKDSYSPCTQWGKYQRSACKTINVITNPWPRWGSSVNAFLQEVIQHDHNNEAVMLSKAPFLTSFTSSSNLVIFCRTSLSRTWNTKDKMSHVTRKLVFGGSDPVRLKPACSAAEAS